MFSIIKRVRHISRAQLQCTCYSTVRKPSPHESEENNNKSDIEVKAKKIEPNEDSIKSIVKKPAEIKKNYDPKDVTKEDMKWRTPWHQKEAHYFSALRTFYTEETQTNLLKMLQTPINLSPSAIKKWWTERKQYEEMMLQSYLPERHQTLGNELAAAHFVVHRGGAVKFYHENKWIKANSRNEYSLPKYYQEDKILEAIDCSNMNLYYEGLQNFKDLKQVEWLSFNGVQNFDDWFLDRISNLFSHSLIYLDIRNCPNYTERGLTALWKSENLKILCIDDMLMTTPFEMTCLMLQEVNPNLDIKVGETD